MQENIQEDLDLLFAEYCYFNTDERCFEDTSKKTKPVPKPEPQDKDEEESEEEQLSWNEIKTELIEVMHEICLEEYDVKSDFSKQEYKGWCSCYIGYMSDHITEKEHKYFNENKKFTDQFEKKLDNQVQVCNELTTMKDKVSFKKTAMEVCEDEYSSESGYTREEYNNYCGCFVDFYITNLNEEEITRYYHDGDYSKRFENKLNDRAQYCEEKIVKQSEENTLEKEIKECRGNYHSDMDLNRYEYNKWCGCYWKNIDLFFKNNVDEKEWEYLDRNDKFSDEFNKILEKEKDDIGYYCFKKSIK